MWRHRAAGPGPAQGLEGGLRALRRSRAAGPGQPLHGLRHPVLQQRLPARQPHPRLERPGLPRLVARGHRPAARHQQLPRLHRPAVPGAVRVGLRARHQPAGGHHQAGRVRDHRARLRRGLDRAGRGRRAHRPDGGGGRIGPGRPGRGPAAHPRRPPTWWCSNATTASVACCATASPSSRWRSGSSTAASTRWRAEGTEFRTGVERRRRPHRRRSCAPTSTPSSSPVAPPQPRTCPFPAASSTASTRRWSSCRSPTGCRRATSSETPDQRRRQAGRHHRRRRHRAPTASAPRTARARRRCTSSRSCPARPTSAPTPPRGRPGRSCTGSPRPTRRAASASSRSTPSASSTTATVGSPRCGPTRSSSEVVDGRPTFVKVEGSDFDLECDLVLLAMGFIGPERVAAAHRPRRRPRRPRQRGARRRLEHQRAGVFVAGDMGRGQSLIVWAIAEGRAAAAAVDAFLMGSTDLPSPVRPTDRPLG